MQGRIRIGLPAGTITDEQGRRRCPAAGASRISFVESARSRRRRGRFGLGTRDAAAFQLGEPHRLDGRGRWPAQLDPTSVRRAASSRRTPAPACRLRHQCACPVHGNWRAVEHHSTGSGRHVPGSRTPGGGLVPPCVSTPPRAGGAAHASRPCGPPVEPASRRLVGAARRGIVGVQRPVRRRGLAARRRRPGRRRWPPPAGRRRGPPGRHPRRASGDAGDAAPERRVRRVRLRRRLSARRRSMHVGGRTRQGSGSSPVPSTSRRSPKMRAARRCSRVLLSDDSSGPDPRLGRVDARRTSPLSANAVVHRPECRLTGRDCSTATASVGPASGRSGPCSISAAARRRRAAGRCGWAASTGVPAAPRRGPPYDAPAGTAPGGISGATSPPTLGAAAPASWRSCLASCPAGTVTDGNRYPPVGARACVGVGDPSRPVLVTARQAGFDERPSRGCGEIGRVVAGPSPAEGVAPAALTAAQPRTPRRREAVSAARRAGAVDVHRRRIGSAHRRGRAARPRAARARGLLAGSVSPRAACPRCRSSAALQRGQVVWTSACLPTARASLSMAESVSVTTATASVRTPSPAAPR